MPGSRGKVLVVHEDSLVRWTLVRLLEAQGCDARSVGSGLLALGLLQDWPADVLICSSRLPGMDGLEVARRCQGVGQPPRVILLRGSGEAEPPADWARLGVLAVIETPLIFESLETLLSDALGHPGVPEPEPPAAEGGPLP